MSRGRKARRREYSVEPNMLHIFSLEKGLVLLTPDYLAVPVGDLVIEWADGRTTIKNAVTDGVIHAEGAAQEEAKD